MEVSLWVWAAVIGFILVMLAVDLIAHRRAHVISVREAALWSAVWVAFGVAFGAIIWTAYGAEFGQQYFAGYLIEKSLAVDNVFVWAIIFSYFAVPREYQHRVLFLGVLGALVFRGIFIALGAVLIANFTWVLYLFAAFLLVTGHRMIRQREKHLDPEKSRALALFRRWVPMTDAFYGQRFLVRRAGIIVATPLLAVLVLVDLIHRFIYLKTGLALVLIWVGIKMMLKVDLLYIPTTISLAVVTTIIGVSIALSLRATRGQGRQTPPLPATQPFRVASDDELAAVEPVWRRRNAATAPAETGPGSGDG